MAADVPDALTFGRGPLRAQECWFLRPKRDNTGSGARFRLRAPWLRLKTEADLTASPGQPRRRRLSKARPAKPASSVAALAGSGTALAKVEPSTCAVIP